MTQSCVFRLCGGWPGHPSPALRAIEEIAEERRERRRSEGKEIFKKKRPSPGLWPAIREAHRLQREAAAAKIAQ